MSARGSHGILPLVARAPAEELQDWLETLNKVLTSGLEVKLLGGLTPEERQAAEVAIVANPDPAELLNLPNLKWVHSLWAGVERLTSELPKDGPAIVRMVDPQMAETMSEAVLAWTLYLHRNMPRYARQQTRKAWLEHTLKLPSERTVTILGLGNLGKTAALRLKANGFNVCGWSRSQKQIDGIETHSGTEGFKTALGKADIAMLLMPLTPDTKGMMDAAALASMPAGASLINFARGPIIDDDALLTALDNGHIDHAVLDVFATEPLHEDHRYWDHPAVTVLPHISAPTIQSTASRIVAGNIAEYMKSGTIPESVDRTRGY
ncbi:2-hydroxyacid dehydrogenase [Roseibium polysiphoniae]|uniref:Glyoxylate/hydroxypyruvate reductase A n=1 Tax=Roseibium polysiphoniae TaxID=2571221 RepID=A0ABR9CDF8_9HYPH|nr:glyoxylate/hydroxypyruvate reductase A [Roseibium polysiphoniae]MBD8876951.1 glyoxylate/hydroxypyruvate reductase A [Roseibium polysiphoniae]